MGVPVVPATIRNSIPNMISLYSLLKDNWLIKNHRIKLLGLLLAHLLRLRHFCVFFDPICGCNLKCKMCYQSNPETAKSPNDAFNINDLRRLAMLFFPYAIGVAIGCIAKTLNRS